MIYKIIAIFILLILSAFFSGSETALFSLNPLALQKMSRRGKDIKKIKYLLYNPVKLLATLLISNMIVNVTASTLAASVAIDLFGNKGIGISIGAMTFVLLVFGEVSPKRYAVSRPAGLSLISARILMIISKVFYPIHRLLDLIAGPLIKLRKREPTLNEEELKTIIDIGHREGVVARQEREMIGAVLRFTDKVAREVMTKRDHIKAASIDLSQKQFLSLAKKVRHSKIPVFKNSLNSIMGIVYAKEIFLAPEKPFTDVIKPILFMHEQRKIKDILEIFESQHIKIAIVFNDKGIVSGLVTMEDIIEEVFGEIYDEFETPHIKEGKQAG